VDPDPEAGVFHDLISSFLFTDRFEEKKFMKLHSLVYLRKVANADRQTDRQTNKQTDKRRALHNFLLVDVMMICKRLTVINTDKSTESNMA